MAAYLWVCPKIWRSLVFFVVKRMGAPEFVVLRHVEGTTLRSCGSKSRVERAMRYKGSVTSSLWEHWDGVQL